MSGAAMDYKCNIFIDVHVDVLSLAPGVGSFKAGLTLTRS